jgi:hypothetical protein
MHVAAPLPSPRVALLVSPPLPRVQQQRVSPDAAVLVAPLQPSCVAHLPRMLRTAAQPPPPLIVPLPPHRPPLSLPSSSYWTPPSHERRHGRRHVCARRPPESHLHCLRPLGLRVSRPWKESPWRRNCRSLTRRLCAALLHAPGAPLQSVAALGKAARALYALPLPPTCSSVRCSLSRRACRSSCL